MLYLFYHNKKILTSGVRGFFLNGISYILKWVDKCVFKIKLENANFKREKKFINELQLCTEYFAVMIYIFLYKEKQ